MAAPVWQLSVDLQTKTATFQTDMADAAKTARGAFTDIKSGASEMSGHVSTDMFASRHAIMAVSEAFGDTMPRAITALLVHLGPVASALEAAFPYAAIGLAAVLLIKHMTQMREESRQLTQAEANFGIAGESALRGLNERFLQAEIRSDELKNDHLGALKHQLELINLQSMDSLLRSFDEVSKRSDEMFKQMHVQWFSFSRGSEGAKRSWDDFSMAYRTLLSDGNAAGASNLLANKFEREKHILEQMQQMEKGRDLSNSGATHEQGVGMYNAAQLELKRMGVDLDHESVASMQQLVEALHEQVNAEKSIADIKATDTGNAKAQTAKQFGSLRAEAERQAAEHTEKMGQLGLAAQREQANASLTLSNATIAERLASDIALADKEYGIQLQANRQLADALDKGANEYTNRLKAMQDKAAELTTEHANTVAALQAKASVEQRAKDLADMEASERENINATEQGSAARLTAILNAIKNEESAGLQSTAHYRELLAQRVQVEREAIAEESKLRAEAGKQDAAYEEAMGAVRLAALREQQALQDSARRVSLQMQLQEEIEAANREYDLKMAALTKESAALDQSDKNYLNKLHEFQDKELEATAQHEEQITELKDKAQKDRNSKIQAAEQKYADAVASGLTQALMGQKSFGSAMLGVINEVESGLLQAAIKHIETNLLTKQSDAAKAARTGFNAGLEMPFPANLVAAPLFAAGMYAQVMAFSGGTDYVPGATRGDTIPAMLTPGEGVVPGGVMDGLRSLARNGGFNQSGGGVTMHYRPTFHVQAIDQSGVRTMLNKHQDEFERHFGATVRRYNR